MLATYILAVMWLPLLIAYVVIKATNKRLEREVDVLVAEYFKRPAGMTAEQEQEHHATAQPNAIGGYVGCDGPECWGAIQALYNAGSIGNVKSTED